MQSCLKLRLVSLNKLKDQNSINLNAEFPGHMIHNDHKYSFNIYIET